MLAVNPFVSFELSSAFPISSTATKILSFRDLVPGWHYGSGGPIGAPVIAAATQLYWSLTQNGFNNTDAFPGANGEIQLTAYHTAFDGTRRYIGIMIEPTGELSLVYEVDGKDGIPPIEAGDIGTIKGAIQKIARDIVGRQWSSSDIFTQKTLITIEAASQKLPSKKQARMVAPLSLVEDALTIWGTATASTPEIFTRR
jgi:hypothetical protein